MTKNGKIKRPVLFCVIAIAVCFTMLIGTTFAWFTASVTSTDNVIKSGKLDISLEYLADTANGKEWTDAENVDNILDPDALYEPGYVSLNFVRVANLGNLALKYQLVAYKESEKSGINKDGEAFFLSDYLVFKFVKLEGAAKDKANTGDVADYTRASTVALLGNDLSTGYNVPNVVDALLPESTTSDARDIYALIVYMPESVGNKANARTPAEAPEITLTLKVVATQYSYEKDSFDEYYDETAFNNDWNIYQYITGDISNGFSAYETKFDPAAKVTVKNASVAAPVSLSVSECNTPFGLAVEANSLYVSYDIKVVKDDGTAPAATDPYEVKIYAGKGLSLDQVKLYHNGVLVTAADTTVTNLTMDADGYLNFKTTSFSIFTIVSENVTCYIPGETTNTWYKTVQLAFNALPDGEEGTVVLAAAKVITNTNIVLGANKTAVLDLNGCSLTNDNNLSINYSTTPLISNEGNLTIKDTSSKSKGIIAFDGGKIDVDTDETSTLIKSSKKLTLNGGRLIFKNDAATTSVAISLSGGASSEFVMDGGSIDVSSKKNATAVNMGKNTKATITGGKITAVTDESGEAKGISTAANADLNVTDAVIISHSKSHNSIAVTSNGTLRLTNVTIEAEATDSVSKCVVSNGDTYISGGTLKAIANKSSGNTFFEHTTGSLEITDNAKLTIVQKGTGSTTAMRIESIAQGSGKTVKLDGFTIEASGKGTVNGLSLAGSAKTDVTIVNGTITAKSSGSGDLRALVLGNSGLDKPVLSNLNLKAERTGSNNNTVYSILSNREDVDSVSANKVSEYTFPAA